MDNNDDDNDDDSDDESIERSESSNGSVPDFWFRPPPKPIMALTPLRQPHKDPFAYKPIPEITRELFPNDKQQDQGGRGTGVAITTGEPQEPGRPGTVAETKDEEAPSETDEGCQVVDDCSEQPKGISGAADEGRSRTSEGKGNREDEEQSKGDIPGQEEVTITIRISKVRRVWLLKVWVVSRLPPEKSTHLPGFPRKKREKEPHALATQCISERIGNIADLVPPHPKSTCVRIWDPPSKIHRNPKSPCVRIWAPPLPNPKKWQY